jgi:hypothetical protein
MNMAETTESSPNGYRPAADAGERSTALAATDMAGTDTVALEDADPAASTRDSAGADAADSSAASDEDVAVSSTPAMSSLSS